MHWKDGYSAKELAKLWFRCGTPPALPEAFAELFRSEAATRGLQIDEGICEVATPIDKFGGMHRNHDQILVGQAEGRKTVVGVEAKAEEEFGPVIASYLNDKDGGARPGSNIPARIELLARAIFGRSTAEIASLRYQLLHAFAGTIIEAKRREAVQSVFMVCEFVRANSNQEIRQQNHRDFEAFIRSFTGFETTDVRPGQLLGPINVPGGEFVPAGIPAYIGKVTVNLSC
ncbi:MAG: hypothetical protein HZA51_12150 [Planctomycetes bacterium]|nr:hypothetical protein [Planctomycetota bacterium]